MTPADHDIPILQFDPDPGAIIDPQKEIAPIAIAPRAVLCFFQDVIADLDRAGRLRTVYELGSEIGRNLVYELDVAGTAVTLMHPGVGAPLAAGFLEELIALGCRQFIACGGCGVLDGGLGVGHVVIPETAVRDEGTSYHYLPPARPAAAAPQAVAAIETVLQKHHIEYLVGRTWTTDGIYRETRARMARRLADGCVVVEMEAAAFFAVAQFRGVTFGQILYGGDDLTGDSWDNRNWQRAGSTREKLFWLAVESCLALDG